MEAKLNLTAVFEEAEEGGYIAYIVEIQGVNTQGETLEEAKENLYLLIFNKNPLRSGLSHNICFILKCFI
jgi:hypothetical protein